MEIRFSNTQGIHIANNTSKPIMVLVAPNSDWIIGDIVFQIGTAVATLGLSAPASAAAAAKTTLSVKNLYDIYKVFSLLQKMEKVKKDVSAQKIKDQLNMIESLFKTVGCTILPGQGQVVNEKSIGNAVKGILRYASYLHPASAITAKIFEKELSDGKEESLEHAVTTASDALGLINPSNFASIVSSVSDVTLFVVTDDFEKFGAFNTNSDHSWIVNNTDISRAMYGKLWQEDRGAGWHIFSATSGSSLLPGDYLEPFQSIDIDTVNYTFIPTVAIPKIPKIREAKSSPQDNFLDKVGNVLQDAATMAVNAGCNVVNVASGAVSSVVNAPKTIGSAPYKLVYQPDGNLVLYRISGDVPDPHWSTNTDKKTAYRAVMQTDGNFVVYSAEGVVSWALWRHSPDARYRNAFIKLDETSGDIDYYLESASKPEFSINKLGEISRNGIRYAARPENI